MKSSLDAERRKVLNEVDDAKATVENAIRLSVALGEPLNESLQEYVSNIVAQLDNLRAQAADPKATEDELDAISDRVKELVRARAYIMPSVEIKPETDMMVDDLRSLGLPADVLAYQKKLADQVTTGAAPPNRAAFKELLEDYDYWDDYTDWYFARVRKLAFGLCGFSAVCTLAAILLCWYDLRFPCFLFAGIAGTGVSILLKMPSMSVYGEAASLGFRIAGRYAAGTAGTLAGYGLLVLGAIHVSAGDLSGNVLDPCGPLDCWQKTAAIVIAIGLLLGFSERALASFEGIVFPTEGKG
jgi:hypothetical protein